MSSQCPPNQMANPDLVSDPTLPGRLLKVPILTKDDKDKITRIVSRAESMVETALANLVKSHDILDKKTTVAQSIEELRSSIDEVSRQELVLAIAEDSLSYVKSQIGLLGLPYSCHFDVCCHLRSVESRVESDFGIIKTLKDLNDLEHRTDKIPKDLFLMRNSLIQEYERKIASREEASLS